ncbi:hypothetical protein ABEX78_32160 [Priestia megaterium]
MAKKEKQQSPEAPMSDFNGVQDSVLGDRGENFAMVPNHIVADPRITAISKAILGYAIMRSGMQGWDFKKTDIEMYMKESITPIDRGFNELIQYGYLKQSPEYWDQYGHKRRKYVFYKDPKNNKRYNGENGYPPYYYGEEQKNAYSDMPEEKRTATKRKDNKKSSSAMANKQEKQQHLHNKPKNNNYKQKFKKYEDNVDTYNTSEDDYID